MPPSHPNDESLKALAVRLSAVAEALDERSREAVQAVSASSAHLARTANELGQHGRWQAQETSRLVGAEARSAMSQGLQQAFEQCAQALERAALQGNGTANALAAQNEALHRVQRRLLWKASLGLLVGSLLAIGSSAFWIWKSQQALEAVHFSEAILRATQAGTLTQCGRHLCVKAPRTAPRFDKNSDFVLLP